MRSLGNHSGSSKKNRNASRNSVDGGGGAVERGASVIMSVYSRKLPAKAMLLSHERMVSKLGLIKKLRDLKENIKLANKEYQKEWERLKDAIFRGQKAPLRKRSKKSVHNRRVTDDWKRCLDLQRKYIQIYESEYSKPKWLPENVPVFTEVDRMFDWYYSSFIDTDKRTPVKKNVDD